MFDIPSQWIRTITKPNFEYTIDTASAKSIAPKQARGIGGCGIHNAMIYIRGTPFDFNQGVWAENNWTWDRVLPFYTRTENNTYFKSSSRHSNSGPVQISFASDSGSSFESLFLTECTKRSQRNKDFNGVQREGCGEYQFLIRDGVRDSSAVAFLSPLRRHYAGRLEIRPFSHVTKIIFEGKNAVGVEYVNSTKQPSSKSSLERHVAYSKREIILSAGAVHSPNILLQSGLNNTSIGHGLTDGVYIIMQFAVSLKDAQEWNHCWSQSSSRYCKSMRREYITNRNGTYASPGLRVGAFLTSPYSTETPDIQITVHPWDKFERNWTNHHERIIEKHGGNIITLEISNNRPRSRGSITRGQDDVSPAVFHSPYLNDVRDAQALEWAASFVRDIFSEMNATELLPGSKHKNLTEYIRCGLEPYRDPKFPDCDPSSMIVDHLCCSNKMGSVVDSELRVYGVNNLRVADASVFPTLPSGNTHATCMMVGERAASLIMNSTKDVQ